MPDPVFTPWSALLPGSFPVYILGMVFYVVEYCSYHLFWPCSLTAFICVPLHWQSMRHKKIVIELGQAQIGRHQNVSVFSTWFSYWIQNTLCQIWINLYPIQKHEKKVLFSSHCFPEKKNCCQLWLFWWHGECLHRCRSYTRLHCAT